MVRMISDARQLVSVPIWYLRNDKKRNRVMLTTATSIVHNIYTFLVENNKLTYMRDVILFNYLFYEINKI